MTTFLKIANKSISDSSKKAKIKELYASIGDNKNQLASLLEETDTNGKTALIILAKGDNASSMKKLLEYGANVNATDQKGESALHKVARTKKGNEASAEARAQVLVDNKADVTIQDKQGKTALMMAAETGNSEVIEKIAGVTNANIQDNSHMTAVMYAVKNLRKDSTIALIKAGADVNMVNSAGKTAIELLGDEINQRKITDYQGHTKDKFHKKVFSCLRSLLDAGADLSSVPNLNSIYEYAKEHASKYGSGADNAQYCKDKMKPIVKAKKAGEEVKQVSSPTQSAPQSPTVPVIIIPPVQSAPIIPASPVSTQSQVTQPSSPSSTNQSRGMLNSPSMNSMGTIMNILNIDPATVSPSADPVEESKEIVNPNFPDSDETVEQLAGINIEMANMNSNDEAAALLNNDGPQSEEEQVSTMLLRR